MEKRPLSLTIIAWLLIAFSVVGLYGVFTMGSNPIMMKMIEQMHISLAVEQAWGVLGAIVNIVCAYGILKGMPWSRVLYVVWGVIGLLVGLYISPMKMVLVLSLVFLVVIAAFLFTNKANDWFSARGFMLSRERPPSERG
jgi:hypothetical protein